MFTCCHPALSREAQLALTLRTVAGFTTRQIASAFLTSEATVAQRIVRAKRKIVEAGIPYRMPAPADLDRRLDEVLAVLYLMFNEGYLSSTWEVAHDRNLAEDATWLARLVVRVLPRQAKAMGLLALFRLQLARVGSRFSESGALIRLSEQDRSLWDRTEIASAVELLDRAALLRQPGPYQLQAAIASCHAEAPSWEDTDWPLILRLYDRLLDPQPSPVIRLNRAVALWHRAGAATALVEVKRLATSLSQYHLLHSTRAEIQRELGQEAEAQESFQRALELTLNPAERSHLRVRMASA
jgi:RNA polymerase sigma-70 factor (ECF subfamily)